MKKKEITIRNERFLVVDLMQPLSEDTEVFPGDPKPVKKVFSDISSGYQHHVYEIGDHVFHPHGDAPKHQSEDMQDKGYEIYGMDYCFNKAIMIDLSEKGKDIDGIKYLVEVKKEDIESFKEKFSEVGAVVIRTGYDKWLEMNKKHVPENIPYINKEAAEFIASFDNIRVIGVDSITVDPVGEHFAHNIFISKNKLIVESLVNLYGVPLESRNGFYLQTSPVKIKGATGGPIVAYAICGKV